VPPTLLLATLADRDSVPERADAWPDAARVVERIRSPTTSTRLWPCWPTSATTARAVIDRLVLAPTPDHLVADACCGRGDDAGAAERWWPRRRMPAACRTNRPRSTASIGEFAVLALTVRAARALEFKDPRGALRSLEEALPHARDVGPVLTARVLGSIAEHLHHHRGANDDVLVALRRRDPTARRHRPP
jgi:hypothetical protein